MEFVAEPVFLLILYILEVSLAPRKENVNGNVKIVTFTSFFNEFISNGVQ